MFAVMGVTGQVGGPVARSLLGRGVTVRAIVREPRKAAAWAKRRCEIALADINDAQALGQAFAGTEGAFVMLPPIFDPSPEFPEARTAISNLHRSLRAAPPGRVVALSTIGAQQNRKSLLYQLHLLEAELKTLPLPIVFLRPAWFMENTSWDLETARTGGGAASFLQPLGKPFPMIAAPDVGAVAAELLLEHWEGPRVVEVEGPDRVSPALIASTLTRLLARDVRAKLVPREDWESTFRSTGMKNPAPRILVLDGFNHGWIEFEAGQAGSRKTKTPLAKALGHLVEASTSESDRDENIS